MLDGWIAYDRLEPISSDWVHTGTLAAAAHNAVVLQAAVQGVTLEPRAPADYCPDRTATAAPQTAAAMTAEQVAEALHRRLGV